ncbi:MAG: hypothetical protein OXC27_09345 [Caldilineaceae bacterium]|nr:hypothetical protein [Caldilineaceae bacterium]
MLNWLAKRVADRIDLVKLANLVEVKLAARLDKRLDSKLKSYVLTETLRAKLAKSDVKDSDSLKKK